MGYANKTYKEITIPKYQLAKQQQYHNNKTGKTPITQWFDKCICGRRSTSSYIFNEK